MNNRLLLSLLFLFFFATGRSQTTAIDFTATDCMGYSHTLFTELNAGKVVVLVWIEPCGGCISDAQAAYAATRSIASSYPGRVLCWISDDQGNTSCSALTSWESANGIPSLGVTTFDNTGNIIDESHYGGLGMPHVVVLADTAHYVYYNKLSGYNDSADIAHAITNALNGLSPLRMVQPASHFGIQLFPNPAQDKISVAYTLENEETVTLGVYDMLGKLVQANTMQQSSGMHTTDIHFDSQIPRGIYMLRLTAGGTSEAMRFTIDK